MVSEFHHRIAGGARLSLARWKCAILNGSPGPSPTDLTWCSFR